MGNETRVKVVKNKVAPPFRQTEFQIMYGRGIHRTGEIIELGVKQGLIEKSGAWYSHGTDRIGQGRKNAADFLDSHPEMKASIEKNIRQQLMAYDGDSDESDENADSSATNSATDSDLVVTESSTGPAGSKASLNKTADKTDKKTAEKKVAAKKAG